MLIPRIFPAILLLATSAACSSSTPNVDSSEYPAEALVTATSASGALTVAVRTAPNQPPVAGSAAAQLVVTYASTGAPASGLTVTVVPWMPAMGHGQSATTSVVETPALSGTYIVTGLDFIMSGEWELRTSFTGTALDGGSSPFTDSVNPSFSVN